MEPPKCSRCGKKEWRHICSESAEAKEALKRFFPNGLGKICPVAPAETVPKKVVNTEKKKETAGPKWKTREEYNAYMRAYMKSYRARKG